MVAVMSSYRPRPYLVLLAIFVLAGCSTSPMSRIDANRAQYESWPFEIQEAVLNGKVLVGMTPEMVRVTLGEPARITNRMGRKGAEEVWTYSKGGGLNLQNSNISLGGNIGGLGVGTGGLGGGSSSSIPEESDVVFQNGVVLRADPPL